MTHQTLQVVRVGLLKKDGIFHAQQRTGRPYQLRQSEKQADRVNCDKLKIRT